MRYQLTFTFKDTEQQAKTFCDNENKNGTLYKRKNKTAHFTKWQSANGNKQKYICWYYY